ncbi:Rad17 cell cycle checkpoint protein-domain-containing protein [Xylariomycetidae sp. FL0641]|nr:Rad17 cell cycle checkpoint protein-domain-containing protein [Xylariomycetidae sp. FL0641]
MAPPAKRRKRNVVQTSDDEEDTKPQANTLNNYLFPSPDSKASSTGNVSRSTPTSPSPARKSSRLAASQPSKPANKSLSSRSSNGPVPRGSKKTLGASPSKAGSRPAVKSLAGPGYAKSADLVSLFSKQAERAPAKPSTQLEDIISDPISDDDDVGEHRAAITSQVGQAARKRFLGPSKANNGGAVASSQKFLRPPRPPEEPVPNDDQRPWSERFAPVTLDELAVHKKKVTDVKRWLEDVIAGRMRQRLLVLKGAAGTGKTTTVRLLAKELRCELLEWRNPVSSLGSSQGFLSASAQFEEFLGRGRKFGQLDTDMDETIVANKTRHVKEEHARKIILIEEFPNTFTRSSTALSSFRNTVLQYLAANTPSLAMFGHQAPKDPVTPVVMVISETLLTTTSASADSFTAHRLLGPEITRHPGTCMIEFNAIAPTLLAGALELIVQKEARKSGRRRTPGPQVLKRLGEIGDIRSAASSLEFLCLKGDADADWGSKVTFTKSKRGAKSGIAMTKGELESLELVSQREASLGIFHAVGKVVYNKRDELPMDQQTPQGAAEMLPDYLASHKRPRRSEVSVDTLIDETGTDTQTFISALHENYVLSCESTGPSDPSSSLDYINACSEYLSEADMLCPSWDIFFGGRGSSASRDSASHTLRQDEITFQVATRGLLFSLPHPVKRAAASAPRGRPASDAFKMFYPTSLKLWREKEELDAAVDHWASTLLRGADHHQHALTDGAAAFRRPRSAAGNNDWIRRQASSPASSSQRNMSAHDTNHNPTPLLALGSAARRELLLERLPYMAHMARGDRKPLPSSSIRDLERIVSFSGIGAAADDDEAADDEAEDAAPAETWATDRPTEEPVGKAKGRVGFRQHSTGATVDAALPVQKLVLSDDDIED